MASRPPARDESVAARMASQAREHTAPELALRRELHRRGLRYRVHMRVPSGPRSRPDVLFTRARVAVFVDGCFWHSCPIHATAPTHNGEWWRLKLERNVARDRATDRALEGLGWIVLRIWEHEDPVVAAGRVESVVRERSGRSGAPARR